MAFATSVEFENGIRLTQDLDRSVSIRVLWHYGGGNASNVPRLGDNDASSNGFPLALKYDDDSVALQLVGGDVQYVVENDVLSDFEPVTLSADTPGINPGDRNDYHVLWVPKTIVPESLATPAEIRTVRTIWALEPFQSVLDNEEPAEPPAESPGAFAYLFPWLAGFACGLWV